MTNTRLLYFTLLPMTLVSVLYHQFLAQYQESMIVLALVMFVGAYVVPSPVLASAFCHLAVVLMTYFMLKQVDSFWSASFMMVIMLVIWRFFFDLLIYGERLGPPERVVEERPGESNIARFCRFLFMTPWGFGLYYWFAARGGAWWEMAFPVVLWFVVTLGVALNLNGMSSMRWQMQNRRFLKKMLA